MRMNAPPFFADGSWIHGLWPMGNYRRQKLGALGPKVEVMR